MKLPKLSAPVKRPELIHPYHSVDVVNGRSEDLVDIRIDLMHGANYNDPAPFAYRSYQQLKTSGCGCWGGRR
ncbi:cyanobactin biosynthesis system PatB/AcyB/McaB family protein [Lyngbya sp. CCAP 1446/10]|uniref:cyanobactin biosynthesis system PatB/AcyB/McaB family protein n=1 Tax=Lyngbya sp. CCAP 1446/10 TaxID=439293 RepID=UPI002238D7A4|nr:cyanobactin biosynthesis system PatB/AcyB/McaB family protein [Lyngbya sp. CCAP 1446/10]MCW6049896.1 cyanobactin biosynthesis system PatB/AcyB/McaB family protein [Lyngbya sp. CCAP 1446/10]